MQATVFDLGYSGLRVTDLVRFAVAWETIVIDTRLVPWSKDPQWRMNALVDRLGGWYIWVKDFGNRRYRETDPDAIELVDPARGAALAARLLKAGSILLLCMCPRWETCHRRIVSSRLHDETGAPICHLSAGDLSPQRRLEL